MRNALLITCSLLTLTYACKRQEKVSAPAELSKPVAEAAPQVPEEPEPVQYVPEAPKKVIKEPVYPDSLFLLIERSPCFGSCPVYQAKIYKSGYAVLEGRKFFDHIGSFSAKVTPQEMERIEMIAKDYGYFQFPHVFDAPVTDIPSCMTVVHSTSGTNWVYDRINAPDELHKFEQELHELILRLEWQPRKVQDKE